MQKIVLSLWFRFWRVFDFQISRDARQNSDAHILGHLRSFTGARSQKTAGITAALGLSDRLNFAATRDGVSKTIQTNDGIPGTEFLRVNNDPLQGRYICTGSLERNDQTRSRTETGAQRSVDDYAGLWS